MEGVGRVLLLIFRLLKNINRPIATTSYEALGCRDDDLDFIALARGILEGRVVLKILVDEKDLTLVSTNRKDTVLDEAI